MTDLSWFEGERAGRGGTGTVVVRKPKKLWKVGDLVRATGLTRQTIHNYCLLGLIQEAERTPSGHRLYDDAVFERLARIERLKRQGKRLQEIAELIDRRGRGRGRAQDSGQQRDQTD